MDELVDVTIIADNTDVRPNNELVSLKENHIREISLLRKDFDLSTMPSNYMRRRSKIEEIIYQAVYSQNNHKSPFASFKIARNCLQGNDKIDIVTGINNLKKIIKSIYSNNEQISIMVHKVGDTYLLDEFDIDALFLRHHHYADWDWLRNFIKQESFQLTKPDISRASLSMRDLYAKFLYHSVSQPSIEMPPSDNQQDNFSMSQLSVIEQPVQLKVDSKFTGANNRFDMKNEDFLNLVDWKLEDLSLVVGSDLSIFGTKSHPCISLRLNPYREPISILTGMDMWLENMLNEVPEVAMCYHDQGIVMREYEILNTNDIPRLAAFNEDEVKSIAKNLSHFLSTNATKEGHTYWLFKEADSTAVKLYDLTNIWEKEQTCKAATNNNKVEDCDNNPFIIPVAVLCYRMAENRVNQWHRARDKRGKTKLTSSQFNKELLDNKLADNEFYFNEIFRLLKNCINLLIKTNKHQELVSKAILMMCRLYLEVDQVTLDNLHCGADTGSAGVAKLDLNDLKRVDIKFSPDSIDNGSAGNDMSLIGSQLFDHCANKNTELILDQAIKLISRTDLNDQPVAVWTEPDILASNTLLSERNLAVNQNQSMSTVATTLDDRHAKDGLNDSVIMHYMCQSAFIDASKASIDQLRLVMKSGFMVALLDEQVMSDDVHLSRDHDCYFSLITAFIHWHVYLQACSTSVVSAMLTPVDKQILSYHFENRKDQFFDSIFVFKSMLMSDKERAELAISNRVHHGWYQVVLYLTSLAYKLSKLSQDKTKRTIILRFIPLLLNFLVAAIVIIYQQKCAEIQSVSNKDEQMVEWCKKNVLPCIEWISEWTESHNFDFNLEENLVALVWTNKAKLYRLASAILKDTSLNYMALDAYMKSIDTFTKLGKKKPSQMLISTICDRLGLCIHVVEQAYSQANDNEETQCEVVSKMTRAVECAEKIHRLDSSFQHIAVINAKLTSLRIRINFVRYYLNLKSNRSLNYDQVIDDLHNDLNLILKREDSLSRCEELTLIQFYLFNIQMDRCEIMSIELIKKFLRENCSILCTNLMSDQYQKYFETDGQYLISQIIQYLVVILRHFIRKCKTGEIYRKKKQQINSGKVMLIEESLEKISTETDLKKLGNFLMTIEQLL